MNEIIQGDVIEVLKTMDSESVDCVITSPPLYISNTIDNGMSETLAYIAGIVDGEGYVGIKKNMTSVRSGHSKSPLYHERIQIRMTSKEVIDFVKNEMGGSYYKEKKAYHSHNGFKHSKLLYCYQATDLTAFNFIKAVLPYLKEKRKQAELVVLLRESKNNPLSRRRGHGIGSMDKGILAEREKLYLEVKKWNHQ